jgi:hypothetical protein
MFKKADLNEKLLRRDNEGHFISIKGINPQMGI